jgi:hypothetical protein
MKQFETKFWPELGPPHETFIQMSKPLLASPLSRNTIASKPKQKILLHIHESP